MILSGSGFLIVLSGWTGTLIFDYLASRGRTFPLDPGDIDVYNRTERIDLDGEVFNPTLSAVALESPVLGTLSPNIQSCLAKASSCPFYPNGQLEQDWHIRYLRTGRGGCYFEFRGVSPSCSDVCDELLMKNSQNPDIALKVTRACKIGCGYAIKAFESSRATCARDCKTTAWHYDTSDNHCMQNHGLGLTIPQFEVVKACEIGCLIGNERPCPRCEERSLNAGTAFDI